MNSCFIGAVEEECLYGLRLPEVGYRLTSISHAWSDPRTYLNDGEGSPIGFRCGHQRALNITVNGRPCGEAPIDIAALPFQFPCEGTVPLANLISGYGVTAGGVYLESFNIDEAEETDTTFTAGLTRHPFIA